MALTSSEAAGIACLWVIAALTGLWYYVFRYKHANDNDDDNVMIGESSPDGHTTVVVKRKKQTSSSQNNVSSIDQLLFPEVANPMLSDVELGGNHKSSQHPSGGEEEEETIQIIQIDGIVKMGYLRKKSTGGRWLRRCFFIKDGKLFYVHKHTELVGKEVVHARQVSNLVISTVKSVSDIDFQIISPGQRSSSAAGGVYELQGENGFEVADWLKVIRQQIEGALNQTLPADYDDDYDYILSSTDSHTPTHSSSHQHHEGGIGMTTPLSAVTKFVPGRQTLSELRERNPYCADCGSAEPEWASLNLCIMICIDCSGIHRKLGTHISKVRSLSLDKWSYNNIQLLLAVGNDQSNEVWEAQLGGVEGRGTGQGQGQVSSQQQYRSLEGVLKPSSASSMEERERFIVRKYADKEFVFGQEATPEQKEDYLLRCAYAGDLVGVIRAVAAGALRPIHEYTMTPRSTAFHRATEGNYPLCVELLCQINCVMAMLVDQEGLTPLELARQRGYAEIEEILVGAMGSNR